MIELVIKIPREKYKAITEMYETFPKDMKEWGLEAIKNGTPLPKGHGDLKDADDIALIDEQFYVPSDYYVAESAINDAPTIIEAEGSESE